MARKPVVEDGEYEKKRGFYVFIESVEKAQGADNNRYLRSQFILDAITESAYEDLERDATSPEGLSILRLQTTERRLTTLFNLPDVDLEGRWAFVEIGFRPGNPSVWSVDANEDYILRRKRENVISFRILSLAETDEVLNHPNFKQTQKIKTLQSSAASNVKISVPSIEVRVLDVGQASCAAIHSKGAVVGYYDAGAPIFFHRKGFPSTFTEGGRVPSRGFVALSHWDFDHYSLALTHLPQLLNLNWYAPDQSTGYNGNRLKALLGSKLKYVSTTSFSVTKNIVMHRGTAATTDRNNSGYVLRIGSRDGAYLLTGDVAYNSLPSGVTNNLIGLGISHHGGDGAGNPPQPKMPGNNAAVSFGLGNHYKHPKATLIKQHTKAGWVVLETARPTRGDCWL
ncbi:hypothetical protein [Herbaspirillum rubrisubalbicans]|uniref:hypothetical protein n=1 Tax=Herbaspirillum rubrisubalbicans TaxID=80842 RepID=UPI000314ABBF|nr:hypothetical protein [Herbaspirillum rubrisubalbicans]